MRQIPFQLRYQLSRGQRLVPHFGVWGPISFVLPLGVASLVWLAASHSAWWALTLLPLFLVFRGYFVGLLDVALHRVREMDLIVEDKAMGLLAEGDRWALFHDGIIDIRKYRQDVWTIQHWNGSVLNVPASEISDEEIGFLQQAADQGRTPEGIQAVVERGTLLRRFQAASLPEDAEGRNDG